VLHTTVPIEYPRTSPTGVATIYNVTGWSNPLACFSDVNIVFYPLVLLLSFYHSIIFNSLLIINFIDTIFS